MARAEPVVGLVGGPVKGHVHSHRRGLPEPLHNLLIYEGPVGIHGDQQAHAVQGRQNLPKVRMQKGLAAGEQEVQQPLLLRLPGQVQPGVPPHQRVRSLLLLPAHAHVAHAAVHVAQRRQLKGPAEGDSLPGGFSV